MSDEKLQQLSRIMDILHGAYNSEGIEHWWTRSRGELEGVSPLEYLVRADNRADALDRIEELTQSINV